MADHPHAAAVERDFVAAWWLLADAADVHRSDEAHLRWFVAGVPDMHLNTVLVTHLEEDGADAVIDETLARMREQGAPFAWWVMPSSRPADLAVRLTARGLVDDGRWPAYAIAVD
ncbi:MAG TPA: hypothetical protein VFP30_04660, partial [Candidatus Limnocylindria bacterium]|nr:hypothetical protein [Candidatus Limnocylindria bacterium]